MTGPPFMDLDQPPYMRMYTIYWRGGQYVAVEFSLRPSTGGAVPVVEGQVVAGATLPAVRRLLAMAAPWADAMIARSPGDAPEIIETWL